MLYVKWLPREVPLPLFGHYFETAQGYDFEHTSAARLEICRCDIGGAKWTCAGMECVLGEGDISVWPPFTPMHIVAPLHHAHTTVSFGVEMCEVLDEDQARAFVTAHGGIARNRGIDYFMLPLHLSAASSSSRDLLGRIMAAVRSGDATSRLRASALFLLLCEEITYVTVRKLVSADAATGRVDYCRHALEYVADHYREEFTVNMLAESIGLTPNYLCTLFKQTMGVTLVQYITQYRIEVAKELLQTTALPVCDVAASVGFADAAYFCRIFKRSEKLPPTVWRASR